MVPESIKVGGGPYHFRTPRSSVPSRRQMQMPKVNCIVIELSCDIHISVTEMPPAADYRNGRWPTMLVRAFLLSVCLSVPVAAQGWDTLNRSPGNARQIVSADLLRHPLSSKTRRMLQRAVYWMRSGNHRQAIR